VASLFVGLMSGTSLDGADAALVDFSSATPHTLAFATVPFPAPLRERILSLSEPGKDSLELAGRVSIELADLYARAVEAVLAGGGVARGAVTAIGCHGQTVRHRPGEFDAVGYTVQLNAPALLAELTGIDVVADFRSRDVAAGGQGAPLVPAFHRAVFGRAGATVAVLNLGGIANLTVLGPNDEVIGFDCGPANTLLDLWCERSSGQAFDRDGAAAARGAVDARLLDALRAEAYFALAPPKSTGLDLFNASWLDARLDAADARARLRSEDVQATLAQLTADVVAAACRRHAAEARDLVVCGGGAFNADLMARLGRAVAPMTVVASDARGLPADQVEASAFAWLAQAHLERRAGNVATATGAAGPRVLGALYPAR